jgi:hypothetical protein
LPGLFFVFFFYGWEKYLVVGGGFMFNNHKRSDVSTVRQKEDKLLRFDYDKNKIDLNSFIVGENEKIKEVR